MRTVAPEGGGVRRLAEPAALLLILALAAALRFWGLRWGLPNALHDYSYHPDEFLIISGGFVSVYLQHSLNPRIYNYPSLYLYLSALAAAVALGWGASPSAANVYLCARVLTATMGTAAVLATWWAGRVFFGNGVGLLAAVVLCVAPLHVQHSHFATIDVPSTLFVALSLGYCGWVLKRGAWRDYVLAGVMSGLAGGTKYNAGLVVLSLAAAHLAREGVSWRSLRSAKPWAGLGCAIGAFVLSTPGSVLWTREFLHGITYEMRHTASGHGLVFAGTGNGFVYTFMHSLWYGLGPGLAVLFLLAVAWSLWRRDRSALVILAFVVPYYALVSISQVRFARYVLPMLPGAAVLIAWLMRECYRGMQGQTIIRATRRLLWHAFCWSCLLYAVSCSVYLGLFFWPPDTRDQAARWITTHVPRTSAVGMFDWPWFYSPPLSKDFGFGTLQQRQEAAGRAPYKIVVFSSRSTPGWWRKDPPQWIVVSDYEIEDAERLRGNRSISARDRAAVNRILADLDWIRRHYDEQAGPGETLELCDWGPLPHDMRYSSPSITIYERKR